MTMPVIGNQNLEGLEKLRATFSSSCGGLQPLAATVGPFVPNNRVLWAHLKMFKIHLENFAEKAARRVAIFLVYVEN